MVGFHVRKLLIAILVTVIGNAYAQSGATLVVAAEHYPSYEMAEDTDGLRGFDYEVIQEAFSLQGYTVEVRFLPWKRVLSHVRRGEVIGALTCAYREDREDFNHYLRVLKDNGTYQEIHDKYR
ncbi:MAG: hypothetical protein COA99_13610 [Moraxellaceae bacterium]|nr:MAG: hypothetical protein COA99_13610 [Moraxellaceae bacterium]